MNRLLLAAALLLWSTGLSLAEDGGLTVSKLSKLGLGDLQVAEGAGPKESADSVLDAPVPARSTSATGAPKESPSTVTTALSPLPLAHRAINPTLADSANPPILTEALPVRGITKENIGGEHVIAASVAADRPELLLIDAKTLSQRNADVAQLSRELEHAQRAARQSAFVAATAAARLESLQGELTRIQADIASVEATLAEKSLAARMAAARIAKAQADLEIAREQQAAAEELLATQPSPLPSE